MTSFDLIVLGSGPGGYVAAIRASQLGMNVAIVEKEQLGGVCLNWGCIPTKALLKSAEVLQYAQQADAYGIQVKDVKPKFRKVIERSRNVAGKMNDGIGFLMKKYKITIVKGYGTVKPGKRVEVTDNEGHIIEYQAQHIVIATGAKARSLPNLPIDGQKIISYREALNLKKLPKKIIVVGAGAIGCEFTYFFKAMGAEVILIELAKYIVPTEDKDVSQQLKKSFEKMGVVVHTMSRVITSKVKDKSVELLVSTSSGEVKMEAELVLSAIGISANIDNIGLEFSGIKTEKGKIITDEFYRTNTDGYYAIGDVTVGIALAHVASEEAVICVEKIAGLNPTPMLQNNIPRCTYTIPEIASVGMTEQETKESGYEILVGKFPFSASGKAQALGHTEGFVKLIFDKKYGEILGAHAIGVHVTEIISEIVLAKNMELTAHEIINAVHPHPSITEAVKEAAAMAYGVAVNM